MRRMTYYITKLPEDHLFAALAEGLPDMAYHDCHHRGLDSIVLTTWDDGSVKTRMFVAWHPPKQVSAEVGTIPGPRRGSTEIHSLDRLYMPNGQFMIGVHNHQYNLLLEPVRGKLFNYTVAPGLTTKQTLHKFEFKSGLKVGQMAVVYLGEERVGEAKITPVTGPTRMGAHEFHTVIVPRMPDLVCTAWIVHETPLLEDQRPQPLLYSPIREPIMDDSNLYQKMMPGTAREIVQWIAQKTSEDRL